MKNCSCETPSEEKIIKPFLKWPGGKRWISKTISLIAKNLLVNIYIEPFLGSGSVFFVLRPQKALLSDSNKQLIDCMKAVKRNPERILKEIWRFSNNRDCYNLVRKMKPRSEFRAAARFIYLNKTCWGGIHRVNRKGEFNTPFGNSGRSICHKQEFLEAARVLNSALIECIDFEEAMEKATKGDLIYVDPPYTAVGQNNGFVRYNEKLFAWQDQKRLARVCLKADKGGASIIASAPYDDNVISLYRGWWLIEIERYSTVSINPAKRRIVKEALIINRNPNIIQNEFRLRKIF